MRTTLLLPAIAIAVSALAWPVAATEKAQAFVDKAVVAGMFEVESSQLALRMSKDADVKKFADMMVADYGKVKSKLEMLARQEGFAVPDRLDDTHAAEMKTLEQAGADVDAPYIKAQLEGHQRAVKVFEDYADNGDNRELQNFAVMTLPTLRMHLETVEEMGDRVGATD